MVCYSEIERLRKQQSRRSVHAPAGPARQPTAAGPPGRTVTRTAVDPWLSESAGGVEGGCSVVRELAIEQVGQVGPHRHVPSLDEPVEHALQARDVDAAIAANR